ncbi:MAG: hypothetical protein JWQ71_2882 [Pedosphaera sp.]|nr:hypothetical protein [Pedosphaera sp.]
MEKLQILITRSMRWGLALIIVGAGLRVEATVIYWPFPGLDLARQKSSSIQCVNNLKQISFGAQIWSDNNGYQFPQGFTDFTNELNSPAVLFCPADISRPAPTNWNNFDWGQIGYQWVPQADWYPAAVDCQCRIHNNDLFTDGYVRTAGGYRSGWPAIIAGPLEQEVTPGSDVQFGVRIAPGASLPVAYQWRRDQLYYVTNIVFQVDDADDPTIGHWVTNRVGKFTITNLNGATNSSYVIHGAQIADNDYYSVTVSNLMGMTASSEASLTVDPAVSSKATNEYWSAVNCINNLKQIVTLGRIWSADHKDLMPSSLSVMTNGYGLPMFGWPLALFCRSDKARTAPSDWTGLNFTNTSYEIFPGDIQDDTAVFCRCKVHGYYAQMNGAAILLPRFASVRRLANNRTELNLILLSTQTQVLEVSTNLVNWTTLTNYTATNGSFLFYETNSLPRRFYRVRVP